MNPLFDFSAKEIGMIQMTLGAIAQTTALAIEEGANPPDGFVETIEPVINKLNEVVDVRIENDNRFEAITQSLSDVEQSLRALVSNPEIEIDEYN